ncbi:MAG TPA: outer membrane protein assembly factor BamD [Polyangia bacterium]|nr:outer membrane protein assembly factor BamD [Polyangia bacterium]
MLRIACKILLLSCLLLPACATSDDGKPINFSLTAKQNYERGLVELKDENYPEALRYFTYVKQKFPFSKYAALAELAAADTEFERGSYQEAIDAYKSFLRLHPKHEKVTEGYVSFRIAEAYVKEMPDDWFLIPPSFEKDQSAVLDALRELNSLIDRFPDSKYLKQAREHRREVLRRLIDHEVFVARFYLDRGHPKGAILRIEAALRRYPDSGRDAELLLTMGETQLERGQPASAKQTFLRVTPDNASTVEVKRAELFLDFIKRRNGDEPKDDPPRG